MSEPLKLPSLYPTDSEPKKIQLPSLEEVIPGFSSGRGFDQNNPAIHYNHYASPPHPHSQRDLLTLQISYSDPFTRSRASSTTTVSYGSTSSSANGYLYNPTSSPSSSSSSSTFLDHHQLSHYPYSSHHHHNPAHNPNHSHHHYYNHGSSSSLAGAPYFGRTKSISGLPLSPAPSIHGSGSVSGFPAVATSHSSFAGPNSSGASLPSLNNSASLSAHSSPSQLLYNPAHPSSTTTLLGNHQSSSPYNTPTSAGSISSLGGLDHPTFLHGNNSHADNNKKKEIKRRTRTGCLTCRKRRIKCDERKPFCLNCEKSKKECMGYEKKYTLVERKLKQRHTPPPTKIQLVLNH